MDHFFKIVVLFYRDYVNALRRVSDGTRVSFSPTVQFHAKCSALVESDKSISETWFGAVWKQRAIAPIVKLQAENCSCARRTESILGSNHLTTKNFHNPL